MATRSTATANVDRRRYLPSITHAARVLKAGGVVAYPTEGVFGVGCLPSETRAVARILELKRRSARKGLLLIAASIDQLTALVTLPEGGLREEILASWPGPVTWVLPARLRLPAVITGGRSTLAVRVTAHPIASALCAAARCALISTSANYTGRPPLRSALAVRRQLGGKVDFTLAGALGDLDGPTPIRDGASGAYLRGGPRL